ncbi:MAG: glutamate-5-semialdehyde dehydrogenase [Armatimonadetes bacterium]|nr:glutamate-5-semialdehyde dehydrogenase [Armatimonadota bacterium]
MIDQTTARDEIAVLGRGARQASRVLAGLLTEQKNRALQAMADALEARTAFILDQNAADLEASAQFDLTPAMKKRLALSGSKIADMAAGLRQVAELPDPVGAVVDGWRRPNGLYLRRVRVPLGVIAIIYESRPNVTADAAGLCLKSGNACILRGGKEAIRSNSAIADVMGEALAKAGLPREAIQLVRNTSREHATALMQATGLVDCLIPRGGHGLLQAIKDNAKVPFIEDGAGVCHTYIDDSADLDMAVSIAVNAKTQYPAVCNAMETLLVSAAVAESYLPRVAEELAAKGCELRGCQRTRAVLPTISAASDDDWDTEYNDLVLSIKVVDGLDEAIEHIAGHGTLHSEAIVTRSHEHAQRFIHEVDAAAVYINASTRFTDGGRFGFGAEIGISTQKLHARGPLGLAELTSVKYIVEGNGQIVV